MPRGGRVLLSAWMELSGAHHFSGAANLGFSAAPASHGELKVHKWIEMPVSHFTIAGDFS